MRRRRSSSVGDRCHGKIILSADADFVLSADGTAARATYGAGMTQTRAALTALIVALAAPSAAAAAPDWHSGTIESSTVTNCNFFPEKGINANAQRFTDDSNLPKVGEVFYVRTIPARTGNGCGIAMHTHVELVLPTGAMPAISQANPVRCLLWDYTTDQSTPLDGCPQTPQQGIYGPAFDQETAGGPQPWEVPHLRGVVIEVPVTSNRALTGTSPACGRTSGSPPCPAASSGDTAQLVNVISDGRLDPTLVPYVPLHVAATPTPADPGNGGAGGGGTQGGGGSQGGGGTGDGSSPGTTGRRPTVSAASTATLRTLGRGLVVTVDVPAAGSSVKVQLSARGLPPKRSKTVVLGKRSMRTTASGKTQLKLKLSESAIAKLKRARKSVAGQLVLDVTAPDGTRAQAKRTLKIKP